MKEKKKRFVLVVVTVAFCVLYLLCAVRPLGTELHLTPEWTGDILRSQQQANPGDELIPFRLGQNIGYFTEDNRIIYQETFPFKAAISEQWCATYGAGNVSTQFRSADGSKTVRMDEPGFPYFDQDRIFTFLPGGNGVAQFAEDGTKLWQYEGYSPITAFSSSPGGSVIGFADGTMVSFNARGVPDQSIAPGGSAVQVILGADISDDGSTLAAVCGLSRQRFVVVRKDGDLSKIIFHSYLQGQEPLQELVKFSADGTTVYYGCADGLGVVNLGTLTGSMVPVRGHVSQIEESAAESLVFVLSRDGDTCTVTILEPGAHKAGSFSFDAESAFIQVRGSALFVGRDNRISRITVSRS